MLHLNSQPTLIEKVIPETLQDKTNRYIENRTLQFMKTFDTSGLLYSTSISPCFYVPEDLKEQLDDPNNELEPAWKRRILLESTPRGTIVMYFDPYKQGFAYYADSQGLPYSLLNAVAMKYTVMFRCRDFFLDETVTPENCESPLIQKETVTRKLNAGVYKKAKQKAVLHDQLTQPQQRQQNPIAEPQKEYSKNRFVYLGKYTNVNFLQTPVKKNTINGFSTQYTKDLAQETELQKNVLGYNEFKKRQKELHQKNMF